LCKRLSSHSNLIWLEEDWWLQQSWWSCGLSRSQQHEPCIINHKAQGCKDDLADCKFNLFGDLLSPIMSGSLYLWVFLTLKTCSELTAFALSAISCLSSASVWLSGSCYSVRSAACLAAHSSSCLRWLQLMHLQDQQIYSIMNSQCSNACWVVHQSENDCRKWTELYCTWATVFLAPASKSLCIFFWHICSAPFHQQCVCVSFLYHEALTQCNS